MERYCELCSPSNSPLSPSNPRNMQTFYHGLHKLFEKLDLSHALEGDGKVKFGYGVYVTSKYEALLFVGLLWLVVTLFGL